MDESFNLDCLKSHNELRTLHKVPPLKLSIQLAEDAQNQADVIAKKSKSTKRHSNELYGENISYSDYIQTGEETTLKWYQEIFDYKFGQERQNLAAICHFAQVIWNDTTEVGFGRTKSDVGQWVTVGRYKKPGNIVGKFLINIRHRIMGWENYPIIIKLKNYTTKSVPLTFAQTQENLIFNTDKDTITDTVDSNAHFIQKNPQEHIDKNISTDIVYKINNNQNMNKSPTPTEENVKISKQIPIMSYHNEDKNNISPKYENQINIPVNKIEDNSKKNKINYGKNDNLSVSSATISIGSSTENDIRKRTRFGEYNIRNNTLIGNSKEIEIKKDTRPINVSKEYDRGNSLGDNKSKLINVDRSKNMSYVKPDRGDDISLSSATISIQSSIFNDNDNERKNMRKVSLKNDYRPVNLDKDNHPTNAMRVDVRKSNNFEVTRDNRRFPETRDDISCSSGTISIQSSVYNNNNDNSLKNRNKNILIKHDDLSMNRKIDNTQINSLENKMNIPINNMGNTKDDHSISIDRRGSDNSVTSTTISIQSSIYNDNDNYFKDFKINISKDDNQHKNELISLKRNKNDSVDTITDINDDVFNNSMEDISEIKSENKVGNMTMNSRNTQDNNLKNDNKINVTKTENEKVDINSDNLPKTISTNQKIADPSEKRNSPNNFSKKNTDLDKENYFQSTKDEKEAIDEIIQPKNVKSDFTNLQINETSDDSESEMNGNVLKDYREKILSAHNECRSIHHVESLTFNPKLTQMAQKWADFITKSRQLGYSNQIYQGSEVGENIVIQLKGTLSIFIQRMVSNWYSEKEKYVYDIEPENADNIGHFSQVVWSTTKEIGIGISNMSNYSVIVCFYYPAGNAKGEFLKNVQPIYKK